MALTTKRPTQSVVVESEPNVRITVDLPQNLHRGLKAKSAINGRTIADVIREAVETYVKSS